MPCILAEEHGLALMGDLDFAGFRIGAPEDSLQHIEYFIRAEDGAVLFRMAERAARGQAEDQLMDLVARSVDPVIDLTGFLIAPKMPRNLIVTDMGRTIEGRSR